jgi:DNA-binding response OmpR family regulator
MSETYCIIIVDNDTALASMLTRLILRCYPTAVVQAFETAKDALVTHEAVAADLLFVDHHLPGMDGSTMIRIVRARGDNVPIIGMSEDRSLHDRYIAAGAMAFAGSADLITQLPALLHRFLPATPRSVDYAARERTAAEPYQAEAHST